MSEPVIHWDDRQTCDAADAPPGPVKAFVGEPSNAKKATLQRRSCTDLEQAGSRVVPLGDHRQSGAVGELETAEVEGEIERMPPNPM
jgi:hypothetical protein